MDRARPFPDAARSIVTLSNPQTPFAESATHRRKALRKALFRLVRGCYSPRRRRKRTVAHADKPTGATHHPPGARWPARPRKDPRGGHRIRHPDICHVQSLCEPCGNPSDGNLVGVRDSLDRDAPVLRTPRLAQLLRLLRTFVVSTTRRDSDPLRAFLICWQAKQCRAADQCRQALRPPPPQSPLNRAAHGAAKSIWRPLTAPVLPGLRGQINL